VKKLATLIFFVCLYQHINAQSVSETKENLSAIKPVLFEGFWIERTGKPTIISPNIKPTTIIFKDCFRPVKGNIFTPIQFTNPVKISDYVSTLGVICRQEIKLDKITPLPFRFRLGSLDYVNWMERKPNAVKPQ
jgi:hypothetical protein